jgi:hypothetical protein
MNRHERRAAEAKERKSLKRTILNWPMVPPGEFPPGRVSHMLVQHDSWCRMLNGGTDCNCNPIVSRHLQPKDL